MGSPIFVALDTTSLDRAQALARSLRPFIGGVKLGLEFFSANGPGAVRTIASTGMGVFLDLKLHDIPNTVAGAVKALLPLGAAIINVHASGGATMMRAAAEAARTSERRAKLIAVTVLTSLADADLSAMGVSATALEQTIRLARLAKECGLDGVVCSPHEIAAVRSACGAGFLIVTPGVRPLGGELSDQKRVMTPKEALAAGADVLVIGRPITAAADPVQAAQKIAAELTQSSARA